MLIPSIDFQDGRVVQLVQGDRLALASDDLNGWIDRFADFPLVQVIDLDAAMGRGSNDDLVRRVAARLPCQVGGGIRSIDRARALLEAGARHVILGSTLFSATGVNEDAARRFAEACTPEALVGAVDARGGRVTVHGWKTTIDLTPVAAVRALSPFVGAFLYTNVDTEGTMSGLETAPVRALRAATSRRLLAAGGIRSAEEIEALDAMGVDAVVGMAIYTGEIDPAGLVPGRRRGNTPHGRPV